MAGRVVEQAPQLEADATPTHEAADVQIAAVVDGAHALALDLGSAPGPVAPARPGRPARRSTPSLKPISPVARFPGTAPATSTELWVGMHLSESPLGTSPLPRLQSAEQEPLWQGRLERLALCAQRFTPRVSLVPPDGLVLEVAGSLHLFNGVEGLSRALASESASLGLKSMVALAPTPLAALVAARVGKPGGPMGQPFVVTELTRLVGQLMPMPLVALRWPEETLERLARMGVRTIGQVLRLPRAGFARRFGTDLLATLDRLTGRSPDLRQRFHARERFRRRRELSYELESHDAILGALAPLFEQLGKFLEARQSGVMKLECLLRHRHAEPTSCVLRLASPIADVRRLTELFGERLNALTLSEPVRSCELRSSSLVSRVLASNSIWQPGEYGGGAGAEATELIERLRARLGPEAVYGLQVLPGHRPENAWGVRVPGRPMGQPVALDSGRGRHGGGARSVSVSPPWPAFRRPLWLLPAPRLLSERDGLPRRRGPLRLLGEAERIETGWWDGGDIARDYFTAVDLHGVRLWVFRERATPYRWFLHGVFG
jgi:protein ImuB